jgi:hypothetical protein
MELDMSTPFVVYADSKMMGRRPMATLTELVETIADVEGIEPSSVNLIARYVREAGYIATHGRGTSAARMNVSDAANLLIGVNATTVATNAARTVSAYRELESYEFRAKGDPRPAKKYGTLGEALEQLVRATGMGELPEVFFNREIPNDLQEAFPDVHIDMKFRRPIPSASLRIVPILELNELTSELLEGEEGFETEVPQGTREWVEDVLPPVEVSTEPEGVMFEFYSPKLRKPSKKKTIVGDRVEEITIGYRTLSAVGKLVSAQG